MSSARPATLEQWLAHIEQQHPQAIAMGLERVREVAQRMQLGRPAEHCIVVGGTNGKGSTVAFIESIARAAEWKVGAYTSPHLLRYNERVRIDGKDVDDASLVAGFNAVEDARGDTALTYFEYGTLCALWLFQQAGLDLAVLEVGLGGRLDAVNIIDADVAVITTVDIDHADWLGNDREAIGQEKAGIIRGWKPLILGEIDPPSSVLRRAYVLGANAIRFGSDFFAEDIDGELWRWRDVAFRLELPQPALWAPLSSATPPPLQLLPCAPWTSRCRAMRGRRELPLRRSLDACSASSALAWTCWWMLVTTRRQPLPWRPRSRRSQRRGAPWRCMPRWPTRTQRAWSMPCSRRSMAGSWPGWKARVGRPQRSCASVWRRPLPPTPTCLTT